MKWILTLLFVLVISANGLFPVAIQEAVEADNARIAFLRSREKVAKQPRKPRPPKAKPIELTLQPLKDEKSNALAAVPAAPLAMGYSIYRNRRSGDPLRVTPKHEFVAGDEIKIIVEPSEDGYLYIFYQDVDGKPEMIFPHPLVNHGENWVEAHVLYQIPGESNWIEFDKKPATQRLFLVYSRQPVDQVPDRIDLVRYCQPHPEDCTWRPSNSVWERIQALAALPHTTSSSTDVSLSTDDRETMSRGLRIKRTGFLPSILKVNLSVREPVLAIGTDLIQKNE